MKKDVFGGHWVISCSMYDGRQTSRRYCNQEEYYQICTKNPKCLEYLKEYVAKNKDVQHIYEDIVTSVLKTTTDIHEVPSNHMSDISKSKEKTSDMMDCDGMPESEPAKDDDMSSNELSIEDG
eukprot:15168325-Ditylum_brightwellii.AAC.1